MIGKRPQNDRIYSGQDIVLMDWLNKADRNVTKAVMPPAFDGVPGY